MVSVTSGLLNFLFTIIGVSELLQIIRSYPSLHKETWCCGYGVDQDINEAYSWYLKAAKSGHMESQYNIGFFHKEGEIVKKNFRKAVHWFSLAASKGDTEAQRDLGYCYFYGQGTKKNEKTAVYWYKKAALKNDDKSFFNLGLCYKHGDGVNQSNRWAKYYLKKAAGLGHKAAKKELKSF